MNLFQKVFLFVIYFIASVSTKEETNKLKFNLTNELDDLLQTVISQTRDAAWEDAEKECYDQLLWTLENVSNGTLWSAWVLESMQLPINSIYGSQYQLFNFDECIKAPSVVTYPALRTQYCLADLEVTINSAVRKTTENDESMESYNNYEITWGVCLPAACEPNSIAKFLKILSTASHRLIPIAPDSKITVDSCQVAGASNQYPTEFYAFFVLILLLLLIAVYATCILNNKTSDSVMKDIACAFCMKKSGHDLVKIGKDDIHVMHGMRTITACLIVVFHQYMGWWKIKRSNTVDNLMNTSDGLIIEINVAVDTFFMMSALLLVKGLVSKQENLFIGLLKRYVRLMGPLALVVFYVSAVSYWVGNGPLWPRMMLTDIRQCTRDWWQTLLMVSNYTGAICHPVTWYIPCDYHLTILGTLLFFVHRYSRWTGNILFAAITVLAISLPGLVTYWNNLSTIEAKNSLYMRSHYRMGSYLVGLAIGYFMSVCQPGRHRNAISKRWSMTYIVTALLVASVDFVLGGILFAQDYRGLITAIYAATFRTVWAMAVGAVLVVCEYGDKNVVNKLLSWPAWVPLSRLSYGVYLVHVVFIQLTNYTVRAPAEMDKFTLIRDALGTMVLGFTASLLIWLLVQAPLGNIINIILYSRNKPKKTMQCVDIALESS